MNLLTASELCLMPEQESEREVVIRLENASVCYRLPRERISTLKEYVIRKLQRRVDHDEFWALREISLEICKGEVFGIIGRNGAGKSTLLKVVARVLHPTTGSVWVKGHVAPLLEFGAGFHPELTGRENIFLNGALLGFSRREMEEKFERIVDFAELGDFIDAPLRTYSSGMVARLGFAIATDIRPDILIVDEVLAVGDEAFQRKCTARMQEFREQGATILLVSHNITTIEKMCEGAVWIDQGIVKAVGATAEVVRAYQGKTMRVASNSISKVEALCSEAMLLESKAIRTIERVDAIGAESQGANQTALQVDPAEKIISDEDHFTGVRQIRVKQIKLLNGVMDSFSVYWQQPISISFEIEVLERINDVAFGAGIRTLDGTHIFTVHYDDDKPQPLWTFEPGQYIIEFTLQNNLRPGLYKLHIGADEGHIMEKNVCALDAVTFKVLDYTEQGLVPEPSNTGLVNGHSTWKVPHRLT